MKKHEDAEKKWADIVAKAWADEKFKKRLLSHPEEICREYGIELPGDARFEVLQETQGKRYLLLPPKPEGNLSEEDLRNIAAGRKPFCFKNL